LIISKRHRFVYLAPPKTASTTLHRWLSQPAFCDERWTGNFQHDTAIPDWARDYFTFASVREPVARAVSLWAHSQAPAARECGIPQMTFRQFVLEYQPKATWFYRAGLCELLAGVRLDAVVRVEYLTVDLFRLPPVVTSGAILEPLPRMNALQHADPWVVADTELAEVIYSRWRGDTSLVRLKP
jgi:hypothetical protein